MKRAVGVNLSRLHTADFFFICMMLEMNLSAIFFYDLISMIVFSLIENSHLKNIGIYLC